MQTILFNILLILTVIWLLVGILFLWQQLHIVRQKVEEESKKKNKQEQKQSVSSVTQDQIEQARKILVGKSKSYRERYDEISKEITTNSQKIPDVPDTSSKEKPADNPNTFAGKNSYVSEETKDAEGTEDDNEMQVDYTMDEPDEDTIIREELQIADAVMPEISPSAILAREVVRITGWHKNDDTLDEENEAEVLDTLQSIQGTQLMDYIKEATLKQEKGHQKLLAAIRKAEEAEMTNEETISPESDSAQENSDASEEADRPLSYYL
ncbi:hypothetical protein [Prevotella histicola]|uniref:hypothetical protein n=1 Tax=Prevotella histicola TaxID=470565 RepID=UPI001CB100E1|nr:hypothetical protein [Prevotella histicola]MBF1417942.1 hypothetical protein [Prevotella histicola]